MSIEEVLRYANAVAFRVAGRGDDEYYSCAGEAALRAMRSHDESMGVPLLRYVGLCVRRAVQVLKRDEARRRAHGGYDFTRSPVRTEGPCLASVIDLLEESHKRLAEQYWLEDVSVRELAARYNVAESTIYKRLDVYRTLMARIWEDMV